MIPGILGLFATIFPSMVGLFDFKLIYWTINQVLLDKSTLECEKCQRSKMWFWGFVMSFSSYSIALTASIE